MKFRAILLALLVCILGTAQGQVDRARLVGLSASVLKIEVARRQGGYSIGSGVAVAADKIVTNCHVTRDAVGIHVLRGGVRWRADAQASRPDLDLCVLQVPGLRAEVVEMGSADWLELGSPMAALGYIAGAGLQASEGVVFSLHRHEGARVIQATNGFTSGASGGGLFDAQLRLVGILTFRLRGSSVHYFAAPVDWVLPMLKNPREFQPVAPLPAQALAYWQAPASEQPRFLRAAALEQSDRWTELLALGTEWTDEVADDPEPWYLRGLALERQNRWEEAEDALERALGREPNWLPALHRLGLVLIQQGRIPDARKVLDRLRPRQPMLALDLQNALERECTAPIHPKACAPDPQPGTT